MFHIHTVLSILRGSQLPTILLAQVEGMLGGIIIGPDAFQLQSRRHPEILDKISHNWGPWVDVLNPRDQVVAEVLAAPVELVADGVPLPPLGDVVQFYHDVRLGGESCEGLLRRPRLLLLAVASKLMLFLVHERVLSSLWRFCKNDPVDFVTAPFSFTSLTSSLQILQGQGVQYHICRSFS